MIVLINLSFQVIIVEDDLEVSPDFFEYFSGTLPLLRSKFYRVVSFFCHILPRPPIIIETKYLQHLVKFVVRSDPSLWCVSAWNDNGKNGLINPNNPELLYR